MGSCDCTLNLANIRLFFICFVLALCTGAKFGLRVQGLVIVRFPLHIRISRGTPTSRAPVTIPCCTQRLASADTVLTRHAIDESTIDTAHRSAGRIPPPSHRACISLIFARRLLIFYRVVVSRASPCRASHFSVRLFPSQNPLCGRLRCPIPCSGCRDVPIFVAGRATSHFCV